MKRMWGTLAVVVLVGAMSVLGHADAQTATSYDIRVTLDPTTQTLVGSERVDYVNDTGETLDQVLFCLIGNWGAEPNPYLHPALLDPQYVAGFDPTWTRIHRVTDGSGEPLTYHLEPLPPAMQTYSLDDGFLVVDLPVPLDPGDRTTLDVEFETRFARALTLDNSVYRDTYTWRFGWNPIAVSPAAREGGFVLPAAGYRVELAAPEDYRVFGGADRQAELETVAGLTTYEMTNDRLARSVPLAIGPDLEAVSSIWNGVDLQAVYLPGGETFARLALSYAAEILTSYADRFGPFGYRRLVLVENPAPGFYGMAADGMVILGRSAALLKDMPALGTYDRLIEYLLAHETAHLWWGIGIGADFDAENWISEGFAEYLSIGYFEEKHGAFEPNLLPQLQNGLIEDVIRDEFGYLNLRQHLSELPYIDLLRLDFDEAIVKPLTEVVYLNGQSVRIYKKGYLVLRALESVVGKETLRDVLVEANVAWRGRTLSVDRFRRLAEDVSGTDLSGFFDDWLYGDARLDIAVDGFDAVESEGGLTTTVRLRREGAGLPVEIRVTLADGSTVRRLWDATSAEDTVVIESASPVVRVDADPDEMLPDADRFNNHYPRRILVDHPFRSEDAPPIGIPLDAYVVDVTPVGISGGFRDDHRWSLIAMPHLEADTAFSELADVFESWDVVAQFAADVNRRLSFSALASVTALDVADASGELDAWFTVQTRAFTHPETGSAGTYWYPTYRLDFTVGARGEISRPILYLAAIFARSDTLTLYLENSLSLQAGIPGFGTAPFATAEWVGTKRFRLAPLLDLDLTASVSGSLLEVLPAEFMFSLDDLHAFAFPPFGLYQIFGRAELLLPPLARNSGYAIFNLTRIEDITASAFVQGGRTWGGCQRVCESGIRIEAGGMLTFRLDAFLGSSIDLSVGYAHPLLGPDGEGAMFVELAGPF